MKVKINLVTGGTGFLGSHLIKKIINNGEKVICLDNNFTGSVRNISSFLNNENFKYIEHDVIDPINIKVDKIWHFACPASPIHYQLNPIKTAKTSFIGTLNMLNLAKEQNAKFLLASTSEIYGNPHIHPQPETYNGYVNPTGIRSCYDEGKRIAETLSFDFNRLYSTNIRVIRIFNTYGPRMNINDGRVVSNFIVQALKKESLTIYGNGNQTRSFCYVDDLIDGVIKVMENDYKGPINLGNPTEITISDLAKNIISLVNPSLNIIHKSLPEDDPIRRKPDITLAKQKINWNPKISIKDGLIKTIKWFESVI